MATKPKPFEEFLIQDYDRKIPEAEADLEKVREKIKKCQSKHQESKSDDKSDESSCKKKCDDDRFRKLIHDMIFHTRKLNEVAKELSEHPFSKTMIQCEDQVEKLNTAKRELHVGDDKSYDDSAYDQMHDLVKAENIIIKQIEHYKKQRQECLACLHTVYKINRTGYTPPKD